MKSTGVMLKSSAKKNMFLTKPFESGCLTRYHMLGAFANRNETIRCYVGLGLSCENNIAERVCLYFENISHA